MSDFDLDVAIHRFVDAALPDEVVQQEHAVKGAIANDATVRNDALYPNLPWQRADVSIPGSAAAGSDVARIPMPQGGLIRHVSISAGSAPSAHSFNIRVNAGSDSQRFSLQVGSPTTMRGAHIEVEPSSWVVIDVTQAGGAEDITITLHYSPFSGGS